MRINKVQIVNFRGFEDKEVVFHDNVTVVIGDNTAGKTSLLHALQVALGAYLQSLKELPGSVDYRCNFRDTDRFLRYDAEKKDYFPNERLPRITVEGEFVQTFKQDNGGFRFEPCLISWYRELTRSNSTTHNHACAGELMDVVSQMVAQRREAGMNAVYPLVLSFGTNRIAAQVRLSRKVKERQQRIEKAYKSALLDKVDFVGALDWLKRYDKSLKDGNEFDGTEEAFYQALRKAIPSLSEIDFDNNELEAIVSIEGRKPERHHYSYMSDGLKAMINIVSEIAYRCIQLNGFLGKRSVEETPGVVLIDEVDLYLHPKWQKHVLADLQKAFPKIQFIVSTHSPFIVQSLKENQLVSFDPDYQPGGQPYTEGLEDIASYRMGLSQKIRSRRFQEMTETAKKYFKALDDGDAKKEELREELKRIEAEFSDNPAYLALIQLETQAKGGKI